MRNKLMILMLILSIASIYCGKKEVEKPQPPKLTQLEISLFEAVTHKGDVEGVQKVLDDGAYINARHYYIYKNPRLYGATPLFFAVFTNDEKMVSYLLKIGADTTIANDDGETPADLARTLNRNNILNMLEARDIK